MKSIITFASAITLAVAIGGCTTTQKVATSQLGDENLSCAEIAAQNVKLDQVAETAINHKGVNSANVAAVIFFWPAAVGNYMDADTAEKLIEKRRTKLAEFYAAKHCEKPAAQPAPTVAAADKPAVTATK